MNKARWSAMQKRIRRTQLARARIGEHAALLRRVAALRAFGGSNLRRTARMESAVKRSACQHCNERRFRTTQEPFAITPHWLHPVALERLSRPRRSNIVLIVDRDLLSSALEHLLFADLLCGADRLGAKCFSCCLVLASLFVLRRFLCSGAFRLLRCCL